MYSVDCMWDYLFFYSNISREYFLDNMYGRINRFETYLEDLKQETSAVEEHIHEMKKQK